MSLKILIIDDGDRYAEFAHGFLRSYEYATRCELTGPCWTCPHRSGCVLTHAHDWAESEQALIRHPDIDVVLLDVVFDLPVERLLQTGDADLFRQRRRQGLAILAQIRRLRGDLPVILMTSREELDLERADEEVLADEYVTIAGGDAFDAQALGMLIERVAGARREESGNYFWGSTQAIARIRRDVVALACTSLPMLLRGESGTGKSALVERVIHPASGRPGPFVSVDLTTIPDSLVASELFGSVRGAFSGAIDRPGLFERADTGTLFLDEIGNLSLDAQRMLLLTLQDRRVTRLGDGAPRAVDVKVVAATNADLEARVRQGTFRADLYARLNPSARIELPPLRERRTDLEAMMRELVRRTFASGSDHALLGRYLEQAGLRRPSTADLVIGNSDTDAGVAFVLSPASLSHLREHPWPGNIRELELVLASATVFALTDAMRAIEQPTKASWLTDPRSIPIPRRLVQELLRGHPTSVPAGAAAPPPVVGQPRGSLREVGRDLERALFERLYESTNGDFARMAEQLLLGDPALNARRVRLRFNQLGLRVRGAK